MSNSRILRIKNAKLSGYYFYINLNKWGDFQICISWPLISFQKQPPTDVLGKSFSENMQQIYRTPMPKCNFNKVAQRCFVKKFLENSQNSQKNTCARVSFLIKLQALAATILKKRLQHLCEPVNFAKFLRTPFLQNTSERLLLLRFTLFTLLGFFGFFWRDFYNCYIIYFYFFYFYINYWNEFILHKLFFWHITIFKLKACWEH